MRVLISTVGIAGLTAVASCYKPSIEACQLLCGSGTPACPNGLVCNNDGVCAVNQTDTCEPVNDSGMADAHVPIDTSCGWPVISNIDPCQLNASGVSSDVSFTNPTGDTLELNFDPRIQHLSQLTPGAPTVSVLMARNLTITSILQIRGNEPLIILVNGTATIDASAMITWQAVMHQPETTCAGAGGNGGNGSGSCGAGGGGGGSLGALASPSPVGGGAGGRGGDMPPGSKGLPGDPGEIQSAPALVPLVTGCYGGSGGLTSGGSSAPGGGGGGGLQISALTQIDVLGTIDMKGYGGSGASDSKGGGGGGGSGGAILLEAPQINFGAQSRLCANGGGGGQGVVSGAAEAGAAGSCTDQRANGGGVVTGGDSTGGNGGATSGSASAGNMGSSFTGNGGGGGGGGVGRIRINGTVTGAPGVMSPPAQ
ncbi:MAG: hypothetical protein AB7O24_16465 [Kofleriaceae bacterium]